MPRRSPTVSDIEIIAQYYRFFGDKRSLLVKMHHIVDFNLCYYSFYMITQSFVEDSFTLTPKAILRNSNLERQDIIYWSDPNDSSVVFVSIAGREPQSLNLEWQTITFGERAYFRCICDHVSAKLYLPPNGTKFLCRRCHRLQYRLSSINRNSVAGRAIYRMNRLQKLSDSRASMSRILYNGNYSKRFESFLRSCNRAGFDSIVRGAEDLKTLIKG